MPNLPPKLYNLSQSEEFCISFLKWWWLSRLQYTSTVPFFSLFVAPWWKVIMLWWIFLLDIIWTTYLRFSEGADLTTKRTPVSIHVKEAFLFLCLAKHRISAARNTEWCINELPSPSSQLNQELNGVFFYIFIRKEEWSWIQNNQRKRSVAVIESA